MEETGWHYVRQFPQKSSGLKSRNQGDNLKDPWISNTAAIYVFVLMYMTDAKCNFFCIHTSNDLPKKIPPIS